MATTNIMVKRVRESKRASILNIMILVHVLCFLFCMCNEEWLNKVLLCRRDIYE